MGRNVSIIHQGLLPTVDQTLPSSGNHTTGSSEGNTLK